MKNMKKVLSCLLLATMAIIPAAHANETNYEDVVLDSQGSVIHTALTGSCLRTQWLASGDACGSATAKKIRRAKTLGIDERTVYFDFDKAALRPDARGKLDTLASILKSDDQVQSAKIVGYADRIGNAKYNDKLSQKRAKAVSDYLVAQGFVKSQVAKTRWLGESAPATKCPDKLSRKKLIACLQPDRKVEVEIEYIPESWPQAAR
ncbi:MAG: OmpA family protein [Alphaproteobacteria bacterium]